MLKTFSNKRIVLLIGVIYFSIYTGLCIHFFIQRCAFIDGPYMIIEMINGKSFFTPLNRFSIALTEWLPVIGIKCGAGFVTVSQMYSLSFPLLFIMLFLSCVFFIKNYWYALILVLITCIGVVYNFFYLPSESMIGLVVAVLAVAWSWENNGSLAPIDLLLSVVFSFFIVFANPADFLTTVFAFGFVLCEKGRKNIQRPALLFSLTVLMVILKNIFFPADEYESNIMDSVKGNISQFFHLQSHEIFFRMMLNNYFWLPIAALAVIGWLLLQKKYLQLLWYVCFIAGFVTLVNSRNLDNSLPFYVEHSFLPLSFFIVMPVGRILSQNQSNLLLVRTALVISVIIITERFVTIYSTRAHIDSRIEWESDLIKRAAETKSKRLVVCQNNMRNKPEFITPKFPFETLFLSKVLFNEEVIVSAQWDIPHYNSEDSLIVPETNLRVDSLNNRYFHFPILKPEYYCK